MPEPGVLYLTHPLNGLLMIGMPILLGVALKRRLGTRWALYGVGAITFVASQAVHLPLNIGLTALFNQGLLPAPPEAWGAWFNPVVLGLTAGLCEEIARYAVYRWWIKRARTWREALMFGAGHGGLEAILLGISVIAAFVVFFNLRRAGSDLSIVPPEQQGALAQQIAAYWSADWPLTLLGAVERAFALCFHLSLAVIVLQALTRRNLLWLVGAILWHASLNAVALIVLPLWGPYWTEAVIGVFALAALVIVFALRPKDGEAPPAPVSPAPQRPAPSVHPADPADEMGRRLEATKYER